MNGIILSWGKNIQRSKSLSNYLGFKDVHVKPLRFSNKSFVHKIISYTYQSIFSFYYFIKYKPQVLVVTAPPVFTVYLGFMYSIIFKSKLIIDCHNGVLRKEWKSFPFQKIIYGSKRVKVLSHNYLVKANIDSFFAVDSIVVGDPIISYEKKDISLIEFDRFTIFVPLSYAKDEPIAEVIKLAKKLGNDFELRLTGNYKKSLYSSQLEGLNNVKLLGFVPDEDYVNEFFSADIILCLTTDNEIQMCASIEALSFNKPFIVSSTDFYESFLQGYKYLSKNNSDSFYYAICSAKKDMDYFGTYIPNFVKDYKENYDEVIKKVLL